MCAVSVSAAFIHSPSPRHRWIDDVEQAACRGFALDIFITTGDADDDPYYPSDEAVAICSRCPIRVECLQWALDHDAKGIWGGTTEYQRRQLSRALERAKCPGCASTSLVIEGTVELCLSCGMSWWIV